MLVRRGTTMREVRISGSKNNGGNVSYISADLVSLLPIKQK